MEENLLAKRIDCKPRAALVRGMFASSYTNSQNAYYTACYCETYIIAIKTVSFSGEIQGFESLRLSDLKVSFPDTSEGGFLCAIASLGAGLDYSPYDYDRTYAYLKYLKTNDRLAIYENYTEAFSECDASIMTDREAAQLIKNGENITVIVPEEGTLSFDVGILNFTSDPVKISTDILIENGFRLPDGRSDETLYPADYSSANISYDIYELSQAMANAKAIFRRGILSRKIFAPSTYIEQAVFYLSLALISTVWAVTLYIRLPDKLLRRDMFVIATLIFFWAFVVYIKRTVISDIIVRYLWYLFYVPMLFLPTALLATTTHMRFGNGKKTKTVCTSSYAISAVLFALVLTNDFHNLVFSFPQGITLSTNIYSYETGYFVLLLWIAVLVITSLVNIFIYNRVSGKGTRMIMPLFFILLMFLYGINYVLGVNKIARLGFDFTATVCILCLAVVEVCMLADLLPNNSKYRMFFARADIPLSVYDESMNLIYKSSGKYPISNKIFEDIKSGYMTENEQRKIYDASDKTASWNVYRLKGGYALLRRDMTEIINLQNELDTINGRLLEINDELEKLHGITREQARITAKDKLMRELEIALSDKMNEINSILASVRNYKKPSASVKKKLALIKIMIGYCKRKCNMLMSLTDDESVTAKDFEYILTLSYADAKDCAISGECMCGIEALRQDMAVCFYNYFEYILEKCASCGSGEIITYISSEGEYIVMRIRIHSEKADIASFSMPSRLIKKLSSDGALYSSKKEDDDMLFMIKLHTTREV